MPPRTAREVGDAGLPELEVRALPPELLPGEAGFEALWGLHPAGFHRIHLHGREVPTPRWQQAYGADYHYTGNTNRGLPVPELLAPYLDWAQVEIDPRLNGLLLNWYDGSREHYIGAHRDSTVNMVPGSSIVTISLGQERVFRLRPFKQRGGRKVDYLASQGTVFVMPWETNLRWTHEVPKAVRYQGRRISITLRAFLQAARRTAT